MVRVHVSGRDRLDSEVLCEIAEGGVPASVPAFVRPLELDEEALPAEGLSEPRCRIRVAGAEPSARAAGEADEALGELRHRFHGHRGLEGPGMPRPYGELSRSRMRRSEQPAEIPVATAGLDEQGDVGAAVQRHLGARDRPHPERLCRMRELERAVEAVVVGERERLVAELGCPRRELLGLGRPVEEASTRSDSAARRSRP